MLSFFAALLQLFAMDGHLRALARTQPVTAAAVMGFWETGSHPDFIWLGWPDAGDSQDAGLIVSDLGAKRWLGQQPDGQWVGLDQADQDAPHVKTLFWLARLAAYLLVWIAGLSVVAGWTIARRGDDPGKYPPWLLHAQVWLGGLAVVVWLSLWNLNELERLPFMVWNTLRQEDVLTSAPAGLLLAGLLASLVIYGGLLIGWIRMLVHAARYGVVPVRKPGARP